MCGLKRGDNREVDMVRDRTPNTLNSSLNITINQHIVHQATCSESLCSHL